MAIPPQEVSAERALVSWVDPVEDGDEAAAPPSTAASLRIRQIELAGFKSFRDRTVLHFPRGVTAVVGPNGCGKSNVVDAIRWVLGEQSVKRLRGEGMEDVIFGGNDRHAPIGMAQVSIVFETDGLPLDQFSLLKESGHPLTNAGPADIMVTRRYLRSGESDYLLNGVACRLRDITELFLGTGLGGKAYAIIEQGRVEQLISAKPEEMRLFIEEAAGTTLYRSRRQMAERKMERTRENLLRIHDILREVERQLASLRRQAKRAEQYRALQGEIEALDVALAAYERARLATELASLESRRAEALGREEEVAAALGRLERARREAREREMAAQRALQDAQGAAYEAKAACDAARQEIGRLETRAGELAAQRATTERDLDEARASRDAAEGERGRAELRARELHVVIDAGERAVAESEADLGHASAQLTSAARGLDAAKDALVGALTEEANARNAVATSAQRQETESARLLRLETTAATLAGREQSAREQAEHAERTLLDLQRTLETLEGAKRTRTEDLRRVAGERASCEVALDGVKESLARVRSRCESLREIQDSRAAYGEGVRSVVAASHADEILALVAEILETPQEYEHAVAAALGELLQAVVMRDHQTACAAVQALRRAGAGRATCLPNSTCDSGTLEPPEGTRRLLDVVRVRAGYEPTATALLGHVLLVPDLDAALSVWRATDGEWTLVTLAGETIETSGAVTGGSERSEEMLLSQRRELRVLEVEVAQREAELEEARRRVEALAVSVQDRESALRDIDVELAQATISLVAAEKDAQRGRQEAKDLQEQAMAVGADLEEVRARLSELAMEAERHRGALRACERRRGVAEETVSAAEAVLVREQAAVAELQKRATDRRVALAEDRARHAGVVTTIERLRQATTETRARVSLLEARRDGDARALEETREALARTTVRIGALEAQAEGRLAVVTSAEVETGLAQQATEAVEREVAGLQTTLDAARGEAAALDVQLAEHRLALSHLDETMRDRYGRELAEVAAEPDPTIDRTQQMERLAQLRHRVASMGDVNVASLGEVAELEERQRFFDGQRRDLEQALEDLKKTIARLNRVSRTRFRETFDRVNETFREVFPKLFPGGKAELRLTDEEQLLDSGVEIVVQPPGKRVGPLDLLSGGEKSLTAVSLIFALFLIKPSPFCFLDEVDAPLDDANIGRFNRMVEEMSAQSQFILITHNKRTMEVADTLYGITMEEPGVSKVVSVRLPA